MSEGATAVREGKVRTRKPRSTKRKPKTPEERRARLQGMLKRTFFSDEFDDPLRRLEFLRQMPDYDEYLANKAAMAVELARAPSKSLDLFIACYMEPVLTKEQNLYMFRQYSLHKYFIAQSLNDKDLRRAERHMANAEKVRNLLANSNMRLAVNEVKKYCIRTLGDEDPNNSEIMATLLYEGYFLVFKAVDYFDWRRGFAFSTYAVWVMKRMLPRLLKQLSQKHPSLADEIESELQSKQAEAAELAYQREREALATRLLGEVNDRERKILELRFFKGLTLKEVGREVGVTRERVRQIQNRGIERIQEAIALRKVSLRNQN